MYWERWSLEDVKVELSSHLVVPMIDDQQLDARF